MRRIDEVFVLVVKRMRFDLVVWEIFVSWDERRIVVGVGDEREVGM